MMRESLLTGVLREFDPDNIIVSKTDLKGRITYCNRVFMQVSGYRFEELQHQPHNIIRHPGMPRSVFKLLWDTVEDDQEIFAYVLNRCKNGDEYWVHAHVTPSYDREGSRIGYHSNRRMSDMSIVKNVIQPLYQTILETEQSYRNAKEGMQAGYLQLQQILKEKEVSYDEFIHAL